MAQRKEEKEQRTSVIACMYSRVFVVQLITGLYKANIKRELVIRDSLLQFFLQLVEDCMFLNLEVQAVSECTFDLIYNCINYNITAPIHKHLGVLSAITHLSAETFQPLAPLLASGLTALVSEYGPSLSVIGCWEAVISILQSCVAVPHALK